MILLDLKNPLFLSYFFGVLFILFFLIFYLTNRRKLKNKKKEIREINDLIKRFNLDKKKINYKKEIIFVSFINSFIVAGVGTFVTVFDLPQVVQLLIAFVLLLALTYALYEIYGRHLKRKVNKK